MKTRERGYGKPLDRVAKWAKEDGYEPIFSGSDFVGNGEEGQRFENYVAALIDGGAITDSAKHTYRHTLTNHIAGTPLGRKNVRFIDPEDVETFWRALDAGDGARRNIAQVLRKGFTRALKRELIEVNPMVRADIEVPSKKRRVRGAIEVLEPEDLSALADAAALSSERDRIIVMLMG
jgi:site-specific recombinase XerD